MSEDQIIKLLLILVFFLILSFLFYLWKNYTNETKLRSQHQLVMQTLAHELRHPVTGFRLSIEAIRPHYDELPDKLSAEFLRLADTSKKMTRIVSFTRSYLHLLLKDGQFQFKNDSVESFQNFLSQVLEDYEDKIELQTPEYDLSCSLDTYWLSTCIKNLVVNALTYGEKPIVVTWSLVDDDLAIVVRDSGQGLDKTLKELVKPHIRKSESGGLGLGLSLVYRLVELMGGELQLKTKPTKFTIVLKGVDGEKTFNR